MMDTLAYIQTKARGAEDPFFLKPGNPKEGRAVFNAKGCSKCHSVYGDGAKEGLDLGERVRVLLYEPRSDRFEYVEQESLK